MRGIIKTRKLIFRLSASLAFITSSIIYASSLIEVNLNGGDDVRSLQRYGFDITYISDDNKADIIISDGSEYDRLEQLGLNYKVIHNDLEKYYSDRLQPTRDDMGGYRTFDEIEAELFGLFEDFDHIVSEPVSIGESIQERPIWAVKISDNPEEEEDDEAEILFTALTHAREVITPEVLFGVMNALIDGYDNDDDITRLVNQREIWFILCVNPDGYVQNEEDEPDGGGLWRKNLRENGDGTIGVDLNRNWGWAWGYDDIGSSPRGRDPTYRGEAAFSEPESQGLREFINEHEFVIMVNFHGYGNLALYPWGYDYFQCPDLNLFTAVAQKMTVENDYLAGTGWETIYLTNGESDDWIYGSDEHDMILAFTPEVGTRNDGFWPARNRVEPLVEENIQSCLALIEFADTPERALVPQVPENVTFFVDNAGNTHLSWDASENEINPVVNYEIMGRITGDPEIDVVENNNESWDLLFSTATAFQPRSNPLCYRFDPRAPTARLTYTKEIIAPDTLWTWIRYDLSRNNNFSLEVTIDGNEWIAAPGLNTEDVVVEGYNHGPCLFRGETNGWERQWWDLSEWSDQMIRFRFRYFEFGAFGRNDFVYLDDLGPIPVIDWEDILADGIDALEWVDEENDADEGIEYYVRSIDAEGDASFWSAPAISGEGPQGFQLNLISGWAMISSPIEPENPRLEDLFAGLIERENIVIFKDENGRFYNREFDFWGIELWDHLEGYFIKMSGIDSLFIAGERVPVDTPLELVRGWNLIPYYPEVDLPVEEAMESIADNVGIVKDDQGRFWYPAFDFNNMEDLQLGQGYAVRLSEQDRLIYPVEDDELQHERSPYHQPRLGFVPSSPDNHSIILQLDEIHSGQIILRNKYGQISGMAELVPDSDQIGIAAWGQYEGSGAGYGSSEKFKFYWRSDSDGEERPLISRITEGNNSWVVNGLSVVELIFGESSLSPSEFGLLASFPNPFNSKVKLSYRLEKDVKAQVTFYNIAGVEVYVDPNIIGTGFSNHLIWNANNFPSGLYFARITSEGHTIPINKFHKLLLIR